MPRSRRPEVEGAPVTPAEVIDAGKALVRALLELVSPEEAYELLTAEATKRANTAADLAELAKFGPVEREP